MKQLLIAGLLAFLGGVGHIVKVVVFDVPAVKADVVLVKEKTNHNKEILEMIANDVKFIKERVK